MWTITQDVDLPAIHEQAPDGMREWSLIEELDWYCHNHSRAQMMRLLRQAGDRHAFVVVDCSEFKRQRFWK